MQKWIRQGVLEHAALGGPSSTFSQGNFAMAAGLAALDVLDRYELMKNAERMGNLIGGIEGDDSWFEFMRGGGGGAA